MLFGRGRAAERLDDELEYHLDRQTAENVAAGMSAKVAREAALREFGNPALVRDRSRATWSWSALESLLRDLRYGARTLRRAPGFASIAIGIMALGIGANVALFTVVRGVLLKPLPFAEPDRLLMLYESSLNDGEGLGYNQVAGGVYAEWKRQNRSFASLALFRPSRVGLSGSGGQLPEKLESGELSWDLLPTLGVQPALGRNFTPADDSPAANGTVILSWGLWKRRFGGDPGIVNQTVLIDAKPYTVIGVMPSWFDVPDASTQVWTPVYHERPEKMMTTLSNHLFRAVGRLKPGVSAAQGTAELNNISRQLHNAHLDDPFVMKGARSRPLLDAVVGDIKTPLYVLLGATFCLLAIACLNVANLLVARAAARRKELAIRTALGGGLARLVRERLVESLLLSAASGTLGLGLAWGALAWLVRTRADMSRVGSVHIDGVVAVFTAGVVVLCAVFSGVISAFSAGDKRILNVLSETSRSASGSPGRAMLRKVLLTVEVGLTAMLLIGAGLLMKSYERLRSNDMGCATDNVLTMHIGLPDARYTTPAERANFFDTLLERVRALPGASAAGFTNATPGQGYWEDRTFTVVEHPPLPLGKGYFALARWADPKYLEAIGIPIRRGRNFNPGLRLDQADEVIVSQGFADQYLPGEEPLGKHLRMNDKNYAIVGVAGDTRFAISEEPMATMYFSAESGEVPVGTLVVRASRNVDEYALPVQRIVSGMDQDLPLSDILSMNQLLGKHTLDQSFNASLLSAFAGLSLLLAAAGLFGVLSYLVAQRTGEIGIRIALGAPRDRVLTRMLADGMWPAVFGLVLGLGASAAAARLVRHSAESMLYRTEALDPAVYGVVSLMLLMVAAVACLAPAWRASRLDPVTALRVE